MTTVFNEEVDKMLLEMKNDDGSKVYEIANGVNLKDIIVIPQRKLESKFIQALEENNLNLDQTVICKHKNWRDTFDFSAVYMCKDFFISLGYYSAGSSVASVGIWKFEDERYFDVETGFFLAMDEILSEDNEDGPDIFS